MRLTVHVAAVAALLRGNEVARDVARRTWAVERFARAHAPVLTGELRDGITSDVDGTVGRVYSTVEYTLPVEYGGENGSAQPFLRPSVDAARY